MHFSLFTFPHGFDTSDVFVFVLHAYTVRFQIVLRPHLRYTFFFGCVMVVSFEKKYKVSWHSSSRKANFRCTNFWPATVGCVTVGPFERKE